MNPLTNRDPADETECNGKCRKWAIDKDCPKHGRPGQITLDDPEAQKDFYDPSTAEIPF